MVMTALPALVEVGPRDGLQNEKLVLGTDQKIGLIERMIAAGTRRIEVASFVNPKRVPQMADGDEVVARLPDLDHVSYIGLCLNMRGILRAVATKEGGRRGVDEAGCVVCASDEFGRRNQGQDVSEGLAENARMLRFAAQEGLYPQVTISVAFGCPFEGPTPQDRVVMIAEKMVSAGAKEIALGDTIGVAVPSQVESIFGRLRERLGREVGLRGHFHDTRGMGIANAWAAMQAGVDTLDSSLGGLGGCPFAPNATGNISSEDLVYMLETTGMDTGMALEDMIATNRWLAGEMNKDLPSLVAKAGLPVGWSPARLQGDA